MNNDITHTLRFENPDRPGRPLKLSASAGRLELRMGSMGITDTVITLDAAQAARMAGWILGHAGTQGDGARQAVNALAAKAAGDALLSYADAIDHRVDADDELSAGERERLMFDVADEIRMLALRIQGDAGTIDAGGDGLAAWLREVRA